MESNHRLQAYKACALPTELCSNVRFRIYTAALSFVLRRCAALRSAGSDPATCALRELHPLFNLRIFPFLIRARTLYLEDCKMAEILCIFIIIYPCFLIHPHFYISDSFRICRMISFRSSWKSESTTIDESIS